MKGVQLQFSIVSLNQIKGLDKDKNFVKLAVQGDGFANTQEQIANIGGVILGAVDGLRKLGILGRAGLVIHITEIE